MKLFPIIILLFPSMFASAQLDSSSIKKAEFFILNDRINRISMPSLEHLCEMGKRAKISDSTNLKRCTIKAKDFNALEKLLVCNLDTRVCNFAETVLCVIHIKLKEPIKAKKRDIYFGFTSLGCLLVENRQFELNNELISLLRPYAPYYFNSFNPSFWKNVKGR